MLELAGVGRTFADGTAAVRDLDLRVRRGEFVSVVGPSGCGKSTLLRLVSGLEPATAGAVDVAPCRLGHVFQDPTLLPWRTVTRNVELLAELEGIPRAERRQRVERVLDLVGLTGFARARPAALSGGMRMRASLARSLVLEPELFLLDEPFGALDELTRERMNDELVALFAGGAFTALFVTHSVAEAVFLSSRVVVMSPRPGRIVGEVAVPFPYPRPTHLRFAPEFGRLAAQVSGLLRGRRRERGLGDLGVSVSVLRTRWLPPALAFVVFLGLWYLVSEVLLDADRRFLLPPPHAVVEVAFLDPVNRAPLLRGLALSAAVALIGFLIAAVIGVAIGTAMSQARWVERSLYPYAVLLQCVPILALVPVIGFWFDFGLTSRVIVTVLIALFPVISGTLFGLQSADRGQHDLLSLHRASRVTRLVKLQFPSALPALLTGLQVAATLAVVGAVVGDLFFKQGTPGIGVLIDLYRARLQTEQLLGAALLACLLGVAAFSLLGLLIRATTGGWHGTTAYDRPR